MRKTLEDIQVKYNELIPIFCDNTSAINISKNPVMHSKTKHIPIKFHFLREQVIEKNIKLEYVETKEQIVDIFTKPLPRETFEYLKQKLGVISHTKGQMWKHQDAFPFPLMSKGEIKLKENHDRGSKNNMMTVGEDHDRGSKKNMMTGGAVWVFPSMTKGGDCWSNRKLSLMTMVKVKEAPRWVQQAQKWKIMDWHKWIWVDLE